MGEYNANACNMFSKEKEEKKKFGGNISVRFPRGEKPLIIFCHDECIFKQYALTQKSWVASNGK